MPESPASFSDAFGTRHQSGKGLVVRGLIEQLLRGSKAGGDRITEAEAVELFGVSRTPVREALLELQGFGLIQLKRNCGAVFTPFGVAELKEIYHVRRLLEVEATRLAAGQIDRDKLLELRKAFEEIRTSNGVDPGWHHDRDLHLSIAEASGNRRLGIEIARFGDIVQAVREIVGNCIQGIHSTSTDEHLAIIDALLGKDSEAAAAAMSLHLAQAANSAADSVVELRQTTTTGVPSPGR